MKLSSPGVGSAVAVGGDDVGPTLAAATGDPLGGTLETADGLPGADVQPATSEAVRPMEIRHAARDAPVFMLINTAPGDRRVQPADRAPGPRASERRQAPMTTTVAANTPATPSQARP